MDGKKAHLRLPRGYTIMPENEEIDLSKARRWQAVLQAVRRGEPVEDVAEKVRDCLYKTLRALVKKIPLGRLIIAAEDDPSSLPMLVRGCSESRDYAQLLMQAAAEGGSREVIVENFVTGICEEFFVQIIHKAVPSSAWDNASHVQNHLARVLESLQGDIHRIASKFAEKPDWRPRLPRRAKGTTPRDKTREMLEESLLGGEEA